MDAGGHGRHRIDDSVPVPVRTVTEILTEVALVGPHLVMLIGRLLADRRVSLSRKLVLGGVLAYLVSPVDLIPDSIPILGQADDLLLAAVAVKAVMGGVPEEVVREYWMGTDDALDMVIAVTDWAAEMVVPSAAWRARRWARAF